MCKPVTVTIAPGSEVSLASTCGSVYDYVRDRDIWNNDIPNNWTIVFRTTDHDNEKTQSDVNPAKGGVGYNG